MPLPLTFVLPLEAGAGDVPYELYPAWSMRGQRARCPVCDQVVSVTATGSVRHGKGEGARCRRPATESDAHERTKTLIRDRILGQGLVTEARGTSLTTRRQDYPSRVVFEYPVGVGLGIDVAVLDRQGHDWRVSLAVEICDTSPILPVKATAFRRLRIPWIEVKAVAVGDLPAVVPLLTWEHPELPAMLLKPR